MGLEGFDVGESRTRSTSGPGFDSQQIHSGKLSNWEAIVARLTSGTKTTFIVGDKVTIINIGMYSGLKGEVVKVKGVFNEKYVVKLTISGKNTIPLKSRFLTRDKRN